MFVGPASGGSVATGSDVTDAPIGVAAGVAAVVTGSGVGALDATAVGRVSASDEEHACATRSARTDTKLVPTTTLLFGRAAARRDACARRDAPLSPAKSTRHGRSERDNDGTALG
jgi:hypothetical protein